MILYIIRYMIRYMILCYSWLYAIATNCSEISPKKQTPGYCQLDELPVCLEKLDLVRNLDSRSLEWRSLEVQNGSRFEQTGSDSPELSGFTEIREIIEIPNTHIRHVPSTATCSHSENFSLENSQESQAACWMDKCYSIIYARVAHIRWLTFCGSFSVAF